MSNNEEYIEHCLKVFSPLINCRVWYDDFWRCINIESVNEISNENLNCYLLQLSGNWTLGMKLFNDDDNHLYYYGNNNLDLDSKRYMRNKNLNELI